MEKSGFFNAMKVGDTWDKVYKAENFAGYFASFIANGIFPNPAAGLQVTETDKMQVILKKGRGWIEGYKYENTDDLVLNIDVADGVLNRIDRIVLRYDVAEREIRAKIKKGEYKSEPIAPTIQRDADIYELALADIKITAGAIKITQADITDLRFNKELCGLVHVPIQQIDSTVIFNQFQSWYSQKQNEYDKDIEAWTKEKKTAFEKWYRENTTEWEKDFNDWFETLKNKLDGDVATKLTLKTIELENSIKTLSGASGEKEKLNKSEFDTFKTETNTQLADIMTQLNNYNSYSSGKDSNGIFTIVEYKRPDGTLYMKSTLSNVNTNGNYQTDTWQFYNNTGTNIIKTLIWTITYDSESKITSKVVS